MSKKILSVALALIFVISTFAVSAFAVGGTAFEEDPDAYTQVWSLAELESDTEGTYKVGVYLDASYLVGAVQFQIVNEDGNAILGGVESGLFTDGDFDIQYTEDGLVFIVPTPADNAASAVDTATTETLIATLSYTLKEGASSATLAIADDAKSETNPGGSLIAVRMSDDNLVTGTMIYGQSATVGEAITIGSAAAPVLKGVNTGYVDAERKYVYGVPAGANVNDYFTVENGSFEMTANAADADNGTGAILTVKDTAGNAVDTYTLIIFGDVNGDAGVDGTDALDVSKHANYVAEIEDAAILFAADVNADGGVDGTDALDISKHANYVAELAVNVWAA